VAAFEGPPFDATNQPERVVCERYVAIHPTNPESMTATRHPRKRRWRDYRTSSGRRPVKRFIAALPIDDQAAIAAAMKDIQIHGNVSAHHLRGDIYEARAYASKRQYRILYSTEGRSDQVLLSIHAIVKTTRAVPGGDIDLAERRLRDWRSRGRHSCHCTIDTVDSMPYST
jgi:phage-related protein